MTADELPVVLYVDDEEINRKVFRANFAGRFPVVLAESGERALEILASQLVAVVLSDERMPGMRGTALMAAIKERHPDVVRVVVTAYGDLTSVLEAVNSGEVWKYVVKPWSPQELGAVIEGALEVNRLVRERNGLQLQLMLAERRAMLGLIAGSIGHELRNTLSASMSAHTVLEAIVPTFESLTEACLAEPVSPAVAALAKRLDLRQEAAELGHWTSQLKDALEQTTEIAQLMVDSMKVRPDRVRPVDLSALCHSVVRLAEHQLLTAGARLCAEIAPGVMASADPLAVRQILLNLLLNAAQAIPPEKQPSEVELCCTRDGERVLVQVTDYGTGIRPEHIAMLFEPLFTTRGSEGSGLGLPISRTLARGIGGELTVSSVWGEGSTCTLVLLPAKVAEVA